MPNEELKNLHHWDVLALSCIDGRFIKRTIDWIAGKTGGIFDFRTEVGVSKALIDSPADRDRFLNLIETSLRLHSIKEVWLVDHVDCGAYGGSNEFASAEAEKAFHVEKLNESAEIINKYFPKLKIRTIYLDWDEIVEL